MCNPKPSTTSTVDLITTLFHGHPSLIDGFRSFLDGKYSVAIPKAVAGGHSVVIGN